jgi:GTP-binding protein LepA
MKNQILDSMDLERERGITIKLNAARLMYLADDGVTYQMNLIDTPGHVDFQYEVSRSLAACEGALLVVDASQGVEAQTLANCYLALENDLEIIPVLNKIDLPAADADRIAEEVEATLGLDCTDAIHASAKAGIGIKEILEAVVKRIPPPPPPTGGPLRALIYDSYYDEYRGVVVYFRVMDGTVKKGDKIRFMASQSDHEVLEVGVRTPAMVPVQQLSTGEVGYMICGVKDLTLARVGDTVTTMAPGSKGVEVEALPGYQEAKPMVFCGLYPTDAADYEALRDAIGKLKLNDAALSYEPENSSAMGFGFRCGFLGLLHMDIVQERLEREYDMDLIVTAPSVVYKAVMQNGDEILVDNPSKMPDAGRRQEVMEPYVRLEILTPQDFTGTLIDLCQTRRGELVDMKFLTPTRGSLVYNIPLAEVVTDFFDQVKSRSKGYASMEYSLTGFRPNDLVRLDIKINGEDASPLASICHRDQAYARGKGLTEKLKELIPRQMFKVPIQACIGVKPVASSAIPPMRKDVLAKCYGGDISRKKKLLQVRAIPTPPSYPHFDLDRFLTSSLHSRNKPRERSECVRWAR